MCPVFTCTTYGIWETRWRHSRGASLRDLMVRMGHDSPAAALIYQHSSAAADEAIAAALDTQLNGRQRMDHSGSQKAAGPVWA